MCRKIWILPVLVLVLCRIAWEQDTGSGSSRSQLLIEYRALQPGEALKVNLIASQPIRLARLRFLGKKFVMQGSEQEKILVLGLDMNLDPQTTVLLCDILYQNGEKEEHSRELNILPIKFPVKSLQVNQKFVTPPASALERIRRESELLASVFMILTPDWIAEGSFILPSDGKITPNFGERRIFNNEPRSPHSGIDISSPYGVPVWAMNSGRVVLALDLYYAGKTVILDHGMGVFSFYCHFSRIRVQMGNLVAKGDVIGEIGATGRVTGPHLHLSMRIRGARVDPVSLTALHFN